MRKKPWAVLYCRPGWPREVVVKRFKTESKGAAFLSMLEKEHGDTAVNHGEYSLVGPAEDN